MPPRKIIFCADGSWNHPNDKQDGSFRYQGQDPSLAGTTNVFKLYASLKVCPDQIAFYDSGVGTKGNPAQRFVGGALGDGLFDKIKDGYDTIAKTYQDGDSIHLFGFSRGAYTVRSLAGMIAACGLPDRNKVPIDQWKQALDDSFAAYRERDPEHKQAMIAELKKNYGNRDVKIAELGVWDTVGSMGIPGGVFADVNRDIYGFLDTKLQPNVEAAWHALAIDEHRKSFQPTLFDEPCAKGQTIDQVWFAGCHSDVGGGTRDPALSDIPLGWMMQKAASKGLSFQPLYYSRYTNLPPKRALDNINESRTGVWALVPPDNRTLPEDATIANSVVARMKAMPGPKGYHPENLAVSAEDKEKGNLIPAGMKVEDVIQHSPVLTRW